MPVTLAYQDTPPEISTRRSWTWLVGLVAAIGVLVAAWPLSSWQMRQSVTVESTGRMKCTGATPTKLDSFPDPAYRLTPGMRCKISYTVTNKAPLTAHLGAATFTLLGASSRIGLRAVDSDPQPGPDAEPANAVYDLDRDLEPGESATFNIDAIFNPRGCEAPGAHVIITQGLNVDVGFLNVSGPRTGDVSFALIGTKVSDCPNAG